MGVTQGGGRTVRSRPSNRSGNSGAAGLPGEELQAYYSGDSNPRGRTTEAVSDALREAILDGVLAPSAWLREDELATVFNVSRTPVREALRRLADEGLAIKTVHHGTIVAPLSLDDILALYVVREDLEGVAARLAATRRPEGLILGLREIHAEMVLMTEKGEVSGLARQNLAFHRLLREATGNPYLERFLTQVEHAVRRVPSTFTCPGRPEAVLREHAVLMDALEAGDAEAAEQAAQHHMRRAREQRVSLVLGT